MTDERGWVWWSDRDSIEAEKISVLACAETIVAVGLSLWLAAWSGFYWQIVVSLLVAPLVLLQSEESMRDAYGWFQRYWEKEDETSGRSVSLWIGFGALVAGSLAYWLAGIWLADATGWASFWSGVLIAILCVNVVVAPAVAVAAMAAVTVAAKAKAKAAVAGAGVALLLGPGMFMGLFLRSLAARALATLCHVGLGIQTLPRNWARNVLMTDTRRSPQLVDSPRGEEDKFALWSLLPKELGSGSLAKVFGGFAYVFLVLICLPSLL